MHFPYTVLVYSVNGLDLMGRHPIRAISDSGKFNYLLIILTSNYIFDQHVDAASKNFKILPPKCSTTILKLTEVTRERVGLRNSWSTAVIATSSYAEAGEWRRKMCTKTSVSNSTHVTSASASITTQETGKSGKITNLLDWIKLIWTPIVFPRPRWVRQGRLCIHWNLLQCGNYKREWIHVQRQRRELHHKFVRRHRQYDARCLRMRQELCDQSARE